MNNRHKHIIAGIFVSALLSIPDYYTACAQNEVRMSLPDSTVVESPDGSVTVEYFYRPIDFGPVKRPSTDV